ncbi:MAG: efflux RND transporter permease subunit [Deltaproteobacteria bacterium]|nr:efflux RND transporter permease subunit [Deltaproteobacteria bacterium]
MKLAQLAVNKAVAFSMFFLIIVGFGIFSFTQLRTDLLPDIKFPIIVVLTQYKGVAPEDMETLISRPIEETVGRVANVKRVSSRSSMGNSAVIIEFDWGIDMDMAEFNVRKNLDFVRGYLPEDADEPLTFTFDPSLQPILILGLTSGKLTQTSLRSVSEERIEPRLERIEGVAAANTIGGAKRQILIEVNPHALQAKGLSISEVTQAIRLENVRFPGGFVTQQEQEYTIRTLGLYQSVDQIRNTVVAYKSGTPVYLRDVADVRDWFEETRGIVRTNRKPAIMMFVQKQSDANAVQTINRVTRAISGIEKSVGEGVRIEKLFDQSDFINKSISNLTTTAGLAFLLTGLVLLFFTHNIRSSLIVSFAIPFSVISTFGVMNLGNLTLNIISLAGLALAIGLLVDNSIVVLENIYRLREDGAERRVAAIEGSSQVTRAITGSTLTTLAVFVPILFVPGIAGVMFNDMVITICFSLVVSLFVALTLIPLLSSRYLRMTAASVDLLKSRQEAAAEAGKSMTISDRIAGFLTIITNTHERSLRWAIRHKKFTLAVVAISFFGALGLLTDIGTEFIPQTDQSYIRLEVEMAMGTALDVTEQVIDRVEREVMEAVPEIRTMTAIIGNPGTIAASFQGTGSNFTEFHIGLVPLSERKRSQSQITDAMRARLEKIAGIKYRFRQGGMEIGEGDVQVKIFGYNLNTLRMLADQVEQQVKTIRGVVDVKSAIQGGQPEYLIDIDRNRTAQLGLKTAVVSDVVYNSIQGAIASRYLDQGEEHEILVRLPAAYRARTDILENLLIRTPLGTQIPLKAVAEVREDTSPFTITRENQQRMASVALSVSGRDLGGVIFDVSKKLAAYSFPPETRHEVAGVAEDMRESFMYLGIAILIAFIVVYMVMAGIFESLVQPFVIIFTVPLAVIGVAGALYLTGTIISVTALIGMIMLIGIVVNNGIIMVDFMNQLRAEGMHMEEAVVAAAKIRLRPVLMTALTTVLAMLPLALGLGEGGETWSPMARSVMGGLLVSTALAVIVIPILYMIIVSFTERLKKRLMKREADAPAAGASHPAEGLQE